MNDLSDEEIQRQLSGEATRGPRSFKGRELAPLTRGLRDLRNKALAPDDTAAFHDVALLHILAEAHAITPEQKLAQRRSLIAATDDVATFRATISLQLDELSDEDLVEAKRVTDDILGIVEKAEVVLAEKKSDPEALAELSQTTKPSTPGPSPEPPDGHLSSSAGS
ncbi:MAG TPA: hypothetical protein VF614_12630 [Chthoniobacteraceae bacterium]|jgi:hypothetical protein